MAFKFPPIGVDFETYSALDLNEVGAYRYSKHPSTGIICAVFIDHTATGNEYTWRPGLGVPSWVLNGALGTRKWLAHNAGFDMRIWEDHFAAAAGVPLPSLDRWECNAVRMSINGYPRNLDDASIAIIGKPAKDKTEAAALDKMMKIKGGSRTDTPELRTLVESRCMTDTRYMLELYDKTLPPTPEQMEWWRFDQECNAHGIPVNLGDIGRMCHVLGEVGVSGVYEHARMRLLAATDYMVGSPNQTARMKEWLLESEGLRIGSLAKDAIEEVLVHRHDITPRARNALEIKRAIGGAAPKKFFAFQSRALPEPQHPGRGWIKDAYVANGAHTGRDTAKGAQVQNLKRVTAALAQLQALLAAATPEELDYMLLVLGEEPLELAGKCVRLMIQAMPGYKLVVGDFSKIETCVLFWLAGEKRGLEMLARGEDIYCDLASRIRGYTVTKDMAEDRQLGKQGILLLGYGGGEDKFRDTCLKQHGMDVTPEDSLLAKVTYRTTYAAVPKFWWGIEGVIRECIIHKSAKKYGCLEIAADENLLTIKLPSGRKLRYRKPRVASDNSITYEGPKGEGDEYRGWGTVHTYGGKFTENVTQAIAHDLQREAALRLRKAAYNVCIRSHDELGAHVHEALVDKEEFTRIMELRSGCKIGDNYLREVSSWWYTIPIVVETKVLDRYAK